MLEAQAKARRAQFGDDPKMPNPMRARLHEEIARVGAADDEKVESRESWITRFWPRVTVAAALATLIVLVPAIWWNQSHPAGGVANVAVRERTAGPGNELNPATNTANTLAKAPAVSAAESPVNLADNHQLKVEPAAKPASEAGTLASSNRFAEGRAATEFQSQAAPVAVSPAGAESKAKSDRMAAAAPSVAQPSSAGGLATGQQFSQQSAVQSFRNNVQVSRAANVLNTFQVEQQGSDIRVLDADGSTYTGKIEQLAKSAAVDSPVSSRRDAVKQTQRYAAQAVRENESAVPQSYFRATGYNVSLKKRVVFEGNYSAPPSQQSATAASNDRERAGQSREQARIVGTVRVNGEPPVEVDAIAESPEAAATTKSEK